MSGSIFGDTGVSSGQVGVQVANLLHPGYPAGGFQAMFDGAVSANTAMAAVNILYLYPFRVFSTISVTSITERLQTVGAGSSVKCAVWRNDYTTARPTAQPLLGTNTGFDTSASTGVKTPATFSAVSLVPGIYWGGTVTTGTPPVMMSVSSSSAYQIPADSAANAIPGSAIMLTGWNTPMTYSTDIMTVNLTAATWTRSSSGVPIIILGWV